jgi:predicted phosphodiesterase
MAVGCSHGKHLSPTARAAVLEFKRRWKPEEVLHLGDWADTTCWRAGARGNSDETKPHQPDIDAGLDFLEQLGATVIILGNHEHRIWVAAQHYNAIVRELAEKTIAEIEKFAADHHARLLPYHPQRGVHCLGGTKFMHGIVYNENAVRDMAEMFGSVVFGHTHRAGVARGRRDDNPLGICVGTLAQVENMDYAQFRKSTLSWSAGIAYGEHTDRKCVGWLHDNGQEKEWRLPV